MAAILVVGSGGREHALVWKLREQDPGLKLYSVPGNAGTAQLGVNLTVSLEDLPSFSHQLGVDLVIVGPEAPLAGGLVDRLREAGVAVLGPTQAAARLESSKAWAKALMERYGIPTAKAQVFTSAEGALKHVRSCALGSIVVKADGLAAGKGVWVPEALPEAESAVATAFEVPPKECILIEERLFGYEVSVFAFVAGETVSSEVAACDYKRRLDGDRGPITGGIGAYSPPEPELWTPKLAALVRETILERTAKGMVAEGCPYQGILYAGLMITPDGPKVVEFNCRSGDPEAQVILPRLQSDLAEICLAVAQGRLRELGPNAVRWGDSTHVGVVMVSDGYPERKGEYPRHPISGLDAFTPGVEVFHGATELGPARKVFAAGGRVLTAVGSGATLVHARENAYTRVQGIHWEGASFRSDIARPRVPSGM